MGVKGLYGLIDCNPEFLRRYFLHDCTVVCDGWNIAYRLYLGSNLDCVYGGELSDFADIIRSYFGVYESANVQCVVLLDGAYEPDAKIPTIQARNRDKINSMRHLRGEAASRIKIMPPLACDVFIDVLTELQNVELIRCVFEADEFIAAEGLRRNCPVLTDDSDFFVFDLPAGVIRLSSMDNKTVTKQIQGRSITGIDCKIFFLENLLKRFGNSFNKELMCVFGAVVGNDFLTQDAFENFFKTIRVPRLVKINYRPPHQIMVAMLNFLAAQNSVPECISVIMNYIPMKRREHLQGKLMDGISRYQLEYSKRLTVRFRDGTAAPDWVVDRFVRGQLPSAVITLIATSTMFHFIQVEALHLRSSYEVTLPLRRNIFRIIFKSRATMIRELDRSGYDLRFREIDFGEGEIGLDDLLGSSLETRKLHFRRAAFIRTNCEEFAATPAGKILLCSIEYLINSNSIDWMFAICLLVMFVVAQAKASRSDSESENFILGTKIMPQHVKKFQRFFLRPSYKHRIDLKLTHRINEFSGCISMIKMLEGLLQVHQQWFNVHLIFNGVFIYNLYSDVSKRKHPNSYLQSLLHNSAFGNAFVNLWKKLSLAWFPNNEDLRLWS